MGFLSKCLGILFTMLCLIFTPNVQHASHGYIPSFLMVFYITFYLHFCCAFLGNFDCSCCVPFDLLYIGSLSWGFLGTAVLTFAR